VLALQLASTAAAVLAYRPCIVTDSATGASVNAQLIVVNPRLITSTVAGVAVTPKLIEIQPAVIKVHALFRRLHGSSALLCQAHALLPCCSPCACCACPVQAQAPLLRPLRLLCLCLPTQEAWLLTWHALLPGARR
jgi:hypothetical protein